MAELGVSGELDNMKYHFLAKPSVSSQFSGQDSRPRTRNPALLVRVTECHYAKHVDQDDLWLECVVSGMINHNATTGETAMVELLGPQLLNA
jgi:hypothetical protein